MHAYLLVGQDSSKLKTQSLKLANKLKAKILEFPLAKIEDARYLKSFVALKVSSPTAIYIDSIENATEEAQNAFLKNLEEPQPNLYYILTTQSPATVLPTVVSRCEVAKIANSPQTTEYGKNIKPTLPDIDKIKDRGEAKEFVQNLINNWHFNLINNSRKQKQTAENLELALSALNNLKANGNVSLQLTDMVINLV
ncbi:hypothetical protein COY30_00095 [Candidatus Woesebacteria bacterium CG_4_10_14_0_2_um_filter_44_9]|uniref:DNA polymerase III subunit delta n=1 Tax=Candidatus Woesebacteria bacterium CG_4_10_14_0_2_um_filter_44_9 TaxID=1975055 RepID=A0A2M7TJ41_9BACT|nr:MAG: hypothetical protein COY30_00095 [Candidatus Woesebacteria bacterium CG_4_10_14_0_2_um_filter_44_9]